MCIFRLATGQSQNKRSFIVLGKKRLFRKKTREKQKKLSMNEAQNLFVKAFDFEQQKIQCHVPYNIQRNSYQTDDTVTCVWKMISIVKFQQ